MQWDIAIVTDPRFPGGTTTAVASEIDAAVRAGYTVGLVPIEAPNLAARQPFSPRLRALIDAGSCAVAPPGARVTARLAQVHSPHVLRGFPYAPPRLRAETCMLVLHHPPADAYGAPYFDLAEVTSHADELLGDRVRLAPVGPNVRAQVRQMPRALSSRLTESDWHNVIDVAEWPRAACAAPDRSMVIGRHSRGDLAKWPATREAVLAIYPDTKDVRVSILGADDRLRLLVGKYPNQWRVLPFGSMRPQTFLQGLDIFVYQHRPDWVEAFGYAAAEALSAGLPCILPQAMAPLFGEVALCMPPEETLPTARALWADRNRRAAMAVEGRRFVADRFGPQAYRARLADAIGPPATGAIAVSQVPGPAAPRKQRVLLVSSNGVGMGHLTRLLAVARRLPPDVEPVFVTMSQAALVVERDFGWRAEFIPHHHLLKADIGRWNRHLAIELMELIDFYDCPLVLFDANSPFQGVVDAAANRPRTWWVWLRRAMWRPHVGKVFLDRESSFDAVLEPEDIAESMDEGLTVERRNSTHRVPPIRLLDTHERLTRNDARAELGLDADRPAYLVALGAGGNAAHAEHRRIAVEVLAATGAQVVEASWMIADDVRTHPAARPLRGFPFARLLDAFDGVVSAAGYNSFHEILDAAIPTLFVPNENPSMDDQLARAMFADRRGAALCRRAGDLYGLRRGIAELIDPAVADGLQNAARRLSRPNGAAATARFISDLALLTRTGEGLRAHGAGWCPTIESATR